MKKFTFGTPEEIVPSRYCRNLQYEETAIRYDAANFKFKTTARGCVLEFPLEEDEQVYGLDRKSVV